MRGQDGDEVTPLISPGRGHQDHYHIDIQQNIYTAALYGPSISLIKTGKGCNKAVMIVCAMIIINIILQMGLVTLMGHYRHRDMQNTQIFAAVGEEPTYTNTMSKAFLTPYMRKVMREVLLKGGADPSCTLDNGTYSCTPASIHFASEWESLDINRDGVWTISEAQGGDQSIRASGGDGEIQKRRIVLFNTIIRGLKQRAKWLKELNGTILYLPQDMLAKRAIPEAFFQYWLGDAIICTRFDSLGCESMVASGLFDAALKYGRLAAAHKGILDYNSAVTYCRMMLEDNGGCDQSLPVSLRQAVFRRKRQCGKVSVENNGFATNPQDPAEVMPVTVLSYANLEKQKASLQPMFLCAQFIIMYLFYTTLVTELRDLIKRVDFLATFPGTLNGEDRGGVDLGPEEVNDGRYRIERISPRHRAALVILLFFRWLIAAFLMIWGTCTLLEETSFFPLVMNALTLTYITNIDELIYAVLIESTTKAELGFDDAQRIMFKGWIPRGNGSFIECSFRKDCWGMTFVPAISICVVAYSAYMWRQPKVEALTCSCLQQGRHCAESMVHQGEWWWQYWTRTLPSAIHRIEDMRLQGA